MENLSIQLEGLPAKKYPTLILYNWQIHFGSWYMEKYIGALSGYCSSTETAIMLEQLILVIRMEIFSNISRSSDLIPRRIEKKVSIHNN